MANKPITREVNIAPAGGPSMAKFGSGLIAGEFIFFSAIRGNHPLANLASDATKVQARQAFETLEVLLGAAGAALEHRVKVTLYLQDRRYRLLLMTSNGILPHRPSARLAVQVADAKAQPGRNAHFALDVIAIDPSTG